MVMPERETPAFFALASIAAGRPSRVMRAKPSPVIIAAAAITRGSSPSGRTMRLGELRARFFRVSRRFTADSKYHKSVAREIGVAYVMLVASCRKRVMLSLREME